MRCQWTDEDRVCSRKGRRGSDDDICDAGRRRLWRHTNAASGRNWGGSTRVGGKCTRDGDSKVRHSRSVGGVKRRQHASLVDAPSHGGSARAGCCWFWGRDRRRNGRSQRDATITGLRVIASQQGALSCCHGGRHNDATLSARRRHHIALLTIELLRRRRACACKARKQPSKALAALRPSPAEVCTKPHAHGSCTGSKLSAKHSRQPVWQHPHGIGSPKRQIHCRCSCTRTRR